MPTWKVTRAQPQCCFPAVVSGEESLLSELLCQLTAFIPKLQVDFRVEAKGPMERRAYGFLYSKKEMPVLEARNDSFTAVRRRMKIEGQGQCSVHVSARCLAQDTHSYI